MPHRVSLRVARGSRRSKEVSALVLPCATLQRRPWRHLSSRSACLTRRLGLSACCGSSPSWALPTTCTIQLCRRTVLHQKPLQVDWVWPKGICVRGNWDFALPGARRIERHTKNHPATECGGGKLQIQSAVLPCLLARNRFSTTPPQL